MIQVSPAIFHARNLVKSYYEDRFMQHSRAADRQERYELVGVELGSLPRFPEFKETINGMQVNFDTVQYAENVINATIMHR